MNTAHRIPLILAALAVTGLRTAVQAYKLSEAENPPKTKFIKYEPKSGEKVALNTQPRDMRFLGTRQRVRTTGTDGGSRSLFLRLAEGPRNRKRQTLQADCSAKKILQQGLDAGMAMSQAISFNKTREMFPTSLYGRDSGFEDAMAGMNPKIDMPTYSQFNERVSYGFEATTTSAGMVSRVAGKGSAYLGSYYDADDNALMGGNHYKLHVGPNPPAANFWSVTVYDSENQLITATNRGARTVLPARKDSSRTTDGSVDIYFGPTAPEGKESNWIQTNKGQSFFVYLRLYGPEQAYFEQSFPMSKIEKVK